MTHRTSLIVTAIVGASIVAGCEGQQSTLITAPSASFSTSSSRSGNLHVRKECHEYTGEEGSFCTITKSNLKEIEVGSRIYYAQRLVDGKLESSITLYPPGPDNGIAFGNVTLDLTTTPAHGLVTFSGGTGKFQGFRATVIVSPLHGGPDWKWDGPYSFGGE
jgi:hypothetical protein